MGQKKKRHSRIIIIRNSIGIVNTSLTFPDCLTFLQLVETSVSSYNFLCESGTTNWLQGDYKAITDDYIQTDYNSTSSDSKIVFLYKRCF